jgi:hypothetical protein
MTKLSRDPAQVMVYPVYIGLVSNIGVLFWSAAAAISMFTGFVMRIVKKDIESGEFFFLAGLLSSVFLVDDFFMIHDIVFPDYLGINDHFIYLIYFLILLVIFLRHRSFLLKRSPYSILITSFALMGVSAVIDMEFLPGGIDVEDAFKIFGIVAYSTYMVSTSFSVFQDPGTRAGIKS